MGPSSPLSPFPGGPWSPLSPWTHRRNQVIAVLLQNVWNKCVRTRNEGSISLQTSGKHFTPPGLKAVLTWRTSATRLMVLLTQQIYIVKCIYLCWLNTICFLIDCDPRQGWNAQNLQLQQTSVSESSAFTGTSKFSVEMHECALTDDVEWL